MRVVHDWPGCGAGPAPAGVEMTLPNVDLQECVERAVEEWLKDSGGGMLTGSVLQVEFVDAAGDQMQAWSVSPQQSMTKTMGLVEWLKGVVKYEQKRFLQEEEAQG